MGYFLSSHSHYLSNSLENTEKIQYFSVFDFSIARCLSLSHINEASNIFLSLFTEHLLNNHAFKKKLFSKCAFFSIYHIDSH